MGISPDDLPLASQPEPENTTSLPRPPQDITDADIERRFTYHRPEGEKIAVHEDIRREFKAFVKDIVDLVPPGREKSLMLTHLEDASFWGHAAIARDGH